MKHSYVLLNKPLILTVEKERRRDVGGWGHREPFYISLMNTTSATCAPLPLTSNALILITAVNSLIRRMI